MSREDTTATVSGVTCRRRRDVRLRFSCAAWLPSSKFALLSRFMSLFPRSVYRVQQLALVFVVFILIVCVFVYLSLVFGRVSESILIRIWIRS